MGHYTYLDGFEPIDRILRGPELDSGKSNLPLFWLAMFDESDLRDAPLTGVRFAARPDSMFAIEPPYLISDTASAVNRLKRRTAGLAIVATPDHRKLLQDFTTFSRRLKPSIVLRLEGLAAMGDHAAFVDRTRGQLRLLSRLEQDQTPELVAEVESRVLHDHWRTAEHAPNLLAGWGWQVTAEERALRARERKWQKAVGDRPADAFVPYSASRRFDVDQLVDHPTLGRGIVLRIVEGGKVEILFRDGPRTLIHARATSVGGGADAR